MKVKLSDVCDIIKGKTTITKAIDGKYPLVVTAEGRLSNNEYQFDCRAVCVPLVSATGHGHASIKRIHYQEGKFALGTILAAVIPKLEEQLNPRYLHIYLSYFKDSVIVPLMRGSANVSLTIKSLGSAEIELPDIKKQLEIVETVSLIEKKKSILDQYLKKQENLVMNIKNAILQLAVQGKLVPQDPNDEPASILLEKIKEEKERLIKEKKIKKEKLLAEISEEEKPYELPQNWMWIHWNDILGYGKHCMKRGPFGSTLKKEFFVKKSNDTYKVYEQKNAIYDNAKLGNYYISSDKYSELEAFKVEKDDLIVSCSGVTLGRISLIPADFERGIINQALLKIQLNKNIISNEYFIKIFKSPFMQQNIFDKAKGSAIPNMVGVAVLKQIIIPVPPLAEQKRIVEKVDSLMALCDELEKRIKKSKEYSEKLMEAILKDMFK